MTRHFNTFVAVGFCVALLPAVSQAALIFGNLGTSPVYDTTGGNFVGNDFAGDNLAEGDTFVPSVNAIFGSLKIALSCNLSCPDGYTVSLRTDTSDAPGAVIESFVGSGASLGNLGVNNPLVVFNSALHPTLTATTQYWITVSTDLNNSIAWNWNTTGDTSDQAISSDGGATWFSPSGLTPGAYEVDTLTALAPEPGTSVLVACSLLLFLVGRHLSRRRSSRI
jgi:hypothetical protein